MQPLYPSTHPARCTSACNLSVIISYIAAAVISHGQSSSSCYSWICLNTKGHLTATQGPCEYPGKPRTRSVPLRQPRYSEHPLDAGNTVTAAPNACWAYNVHAQNIIKIQRTLWYMKPVPPDAQPTTLPTVHAVHLPPTLCAKRCCLITALSARNSRAPEQTNRTCQQTATQQAYCVAKLTASALHKHCFRSCK